MKKLFALVLATITLLFCFVGCDILKKPTGDETGKEITKSGLNHRFRKLKEFAKKIKNN